MARQILSLLALFLYAASMVAAVDFSINNPVASTEWKAGQEVTVSWIINPDGGPANLPATVNVNLMKGDGNFDAATFIGKLGTATIADGKATLTLPADLAVGEDYFIQMGTPEYYKYSAPFTIEGGAPKPSGSKTENPTVTASNTATITAEATESSNATMTASATKSKSTSKPSTAVNNNSSFIYNLSPVALVAAILFSLVI